MKNELTTTEAKGATLVPFVEKTDLAEFKEVSSPSSFLPYVQLLGSNSEKVKDGSFPIGHFALCENQQLVDLGDEFITILLAWRPKAMRFGEEPISVHDPNDPEFQRIKAEALGPNSEGTGFGPEFLLWVPDYERYATYFLGNKTGRREAGNVQTFMGQACKLKSHLIKTKKYSWHGPQVAEFAGNVKVPDWTEAEEIVNIFKNPPKSDVESVDAPSRER